ncbi:MAG: phycocyanin subunit alpha, partial [Merismopedia sp. SIO2A8]|nr:phycocyanin subunit alpha [Merismopedia sp. SIO2A8]
MKISTINAICAHAHDQARFLNDSEMQHIWNRFQKASIGLEAAKQLARCSDSLAQRASQAVYM